MLVAVLGVDEAVARFDLLLGRAGASMETFVGTAGTLPSARGFDGILLSGSPSGVHEKAPWMKPLADWALDAARAGTGVLGICFGHQLLGWALGGTVEKNAAGPERGTCWIDLTDDGADDPLFAGLPRRIEVSQLHNDHLVGPPTARGTRRLAGSAHTPWQSFRCRNIAGVQFHPEVDRGLLERMAAKEGAPVEARDAPDQERVIGNWVATLRT